VARRGVDEIEPGFVLEHRGSRLGVVERVEHGDGRGPSLVHVRGGRSGSLEYLVAACDLVDVRRERGVGEVRPDVDFLEATLEADGRVTLVARERAARTPRGALSRDCVGYDCVTGDGRVGRVDEVLTGPTGEAAFLTLCVRRRGRRRHLELPASRVIAVDQVERVVVVRGRRDELRAAVTRHGRCQWRLGVL